MMESLRRKRIGSHLSDNGGDHARKVKKKCNFQEPRNGDANGGNILMTAPPSTSSSPLSPNRGYKRKLGCLDSSTKVGRKKKLESEFVLGELIGQGKFGCVRICKSKVASEEFAVKTLKKNGEESVHREVEIMQHLSGHQNVVALRSVFEDSENFHLVMELCGGGRLLDEMKKGRFSEQKAAKLVKDLVGVIKYCHEMGVVHRDIKPENVLMTASGEMKLADFGLAVRVTSESRSDALPIKKSKASAVGRLDFGALSIADGSLRASPYSTSWTGGRSDNEHGGLVDALAAAISRVRISEPKRSRLCLPANPIQQEGSSNMKANNLCAAF